MQVSICQMRQSIDGHHMFLFLHIIINVLRCHVHTIILFCVAITTVASIFGGLLFGLDIIILIGLKVIDRIYDLVNTNG
jgi:hypothetical protein